MARCVAEGTVCGEDNSIKTFGCLSVSYTFLYHATCHFTILCFICQDLCTVHCVVVISARLVDRLSGATSSAIQCTASVYSFILKQIL